MSEISEINFMQNSVRGFTFLFLVVEVQLYRAWHIVSEEAHQTKYFDAPSEEKTSDVVMFEVQKYFLYYVQVLLRRDCFVVKAVIELILGCSTRSLASHG